MISVRPTPHFLQQKQLHIHFCIHSVVQISGDLWEKSELRSEMRLKVWTPVKEDISSFNMDYSIPSTFQEIKQILCHQTQKSLHHTSCWVKPDLYIIPPCDSCLLRAKNKGRYITQLTSVQSTPLCKITPPFHFQRVKSLCICVLSEPCRHPVYRIWLYRWGRGLCWTTKFQVFAGPGDWRTIGPGRRDTTWVCRNTPDNLTPNQLL